MNTIATLAATVLIFTLVLLIAVAVNVALVALCLNVIAGFGLSFAKVLGLGTLATVLLANRSSAPSD